MRMNEDEEHDVIHNLIKPKFKALKIQVTIPLSATCLGKIQALSEP
jgi:hypothetical protein